jgi:acetyl esterase/lipase
MLKVFQLGSVAVLMAVLAAGCGWMSQDREKAAAPPSDSKKEKNVVEGVLEAPGKIIGGAIDGATEIVVSTGVVAGTAGGIIGQTVVDAARVGAPETIRCQRRAEYARVGTEVLAADIFWPEVSGTFPVVVNFHGGAWHKKDQEPYAEHICRWLCNKGYVVFNASYRLAPEYHFPVQVNDALGAILFAKTVAAKYNGDPTRVAVMGDSAGGNLAAMCALCWDDPYFKPTYAGDGKATAQTQANVFLFAVYDLEWMYKMFGLYAIIDNPPEVGKMYIGGKLEDMREQYRRASPVNHLRKDLSPTLIVCGINDPLFPQSKSFHQKLNEMGVPNGLYAAEDETHAFTAFPLNKGAKDAYNAVNAFLNLVLKTPRPSPPGTPPAK